MNMTYSLSGLAKIEVGGGGGNGHSSCFAKVVSLRRFRRLTDRGRAVNRPRVGVGSDTGWER